VTTNLEIALPEKPFPSFEWHGTDSKKVDSQITKTPARFSIKTERLVKSGAGIINSIPPVINSVIIKGITTIETLKE